MLDDFRDAEVFADEDLGEAEAYQVEASDEDLVFGMTPVQRFVLALLFFLSMCLLGSFCLLVTDKIALPFLY